MPEAPIEPATLDKDHKAPETRFKTATGLYSAYRRSVEEAGPLDWRFTSIRGIYDLKPPTDPAYLKHMGMEDMPNFNTGEFKSKIDSYVATWIDHNTGGYKFFTVKLKRKEGVPPEVCDFYDDKATDFFNEAITEWEDDETIRSAAPYILESCIRDLQMGLFGIGVCYFKDDTDWRFCSIPTRKIKVPRGTKITLGNCPALFLETEATITDLYNRVKDSSDEDGWNKEAVYDILYNNTAQTDLTGARETLAEWQNRLRNNDSFLHSNFEMVEMVDCYVQEFNVSRRKDGISHYVIARNGASQEILFKKERRYRNFRGFLIPFSDNAGPEGDWPGVKGFGDSIYDPCDFGNQFFNDMARSALIANMPMFMANSEADRDKLSQVRWTKYGILNPGLQLSQVKVNTDLNGMMGVYQANQRAVNTSSRTYPTGESLGQEAKTATQSTFDRQDQAKLSTGQIKFYRLTGLDTLGGVMYHRLSRKASDYPESLPGGRAAKNFREKCEEAGIPEECYSEPIKVEADRTGGTGNMALDVMKGEKLLSIASPGRGQLNARKEIAKALTGTDRVDEFVQSEEVPQQQQWLIDIENSNLTDGQSMPAREDQEHFLHLGPLDPNGQGHFGVLLTAYQAASGLAKQGVENSLEDAQKLHRVLEATLTHVGMHVQFIGKMGIPQYKEAAKQMMKPLNDVAQFIQTFAQQIGAALEQQQPAGPQMSSRDQAKIISAQVDARIKAAFAEQELAYQQRNQDMKLGNMAERSAVKQEIQLTEAQQRAIQKEREFNLDAGITASEAFMDQRIKEAELAKTRAQANVQTVE